MPRMAWGSSRKARGKFREIAEGTLAAHTLNSVALWGEMPPRFLGPLVALGVALVLACGEHGLLPSTVDPGPDFSVADVVFDDGFYYCVIEPMFFAQGCGTGDPGRGEGAACHANVTSFRLSDYSPRVGDSCNGVLPAGGNIPAVAQQNYQGSSARMRRDPEAAPLFLRPTGKAQHPRVIFDASSPEADLIRQWATQYSTQ